MNNIFRLFSLGVVCLFRSLLFAAQVGTLHVRIVSPEGSPVTAAAVQLTNVDTGKEWNSSALANSPDGVVTMTNIPFGQYRLFLIAPRLAVKNTDAPIAIDQPHKWITRSFPRSNQTIQYPRKSGEAQLSGKLRNQKGEPVPAWIKLVGVFDSSSVEAATERSGTFALPTVRPGRYLVIATTGTATVLTQTILLHDGANSVDLQWPE